MKISHIHSLIDTILPPRTLTPPPQKRIIFGDIHPTSFPDILYLRVSRLTPPLDMVLPISLASSSVFTKSPISYDFRIHLIYPVIQDRWVQYLTINHLYLPSYLTQL